MLRHIGLIPDGNRRWARANSMNYQEAYIESMHRIVECIKLFFNAGFYTCSVYLLSTANLSRDRDDLISVLEAETILLSSFLPSVVNELECRIKVAGRASLLPDTMRSALEKLQQRSEKFSKRTLYILIAYDPIDELNAAIKLSIQRNEPFNFFLHSWVQEPVDVIIRTAGGPSLLSNFIPLQCGYAQIYIIEKLFPECTNDDFIKVINEANETKMMYGR